MVTLSCLIVLASLFSEMTSSLTQSATGKVLEIIFFYYIVRLSLIFTTHVILCGLRAKWLKKQLSIPFTGSSVHPVPSTTSKAGRNMYSKTKAAKPPKDYAFLSHVVFAIGVSTDIIFIVAMALQVCEKREGIRAKYHQYV